ncbi:MAG: DegT/DnrJ/EryC1/StrS family aminotransferase [Spirochaetia bacterium]|nr:DegT/DnrJ/EryC1/StrS family aminotransferase [Spirochaetia bacterium]MCF7946460.1 DegT/DnrJ/EryC1/StrS family aminotransferase [Spirochaetia bacterium]
MIRLYKPTLKRKDMDSVLRCMVDEKIGPGEKNKEFSLMLKKYLDAEKVYALRTFQDALELSLKTILTDQEKKQVAVSILSPLVYTSIIEKVGAEPVFVDVDKNTLLIDPKALSEIDAQAAIIHEPFGAVPADPLYGQLNFPIIEDISESLGSEKNEVKSGKIGSLVIEGFEEKSIITTGGGAAVCVRNSVYKKTAKELFKRNFSEYDLMPDLNAALGVEQLKKIEEFIGKRREIFFMMQKAVLKTRHHSLVEISDDFSGNCSAFPVLIETDLRGIMKFTRKYKIEVDKPFDNSILQAFEDKSAYPNAASFVLRTINFPIYPLLPTDQLKTLIRVLSTLP